MTATRQAYVGRSIPRVEDERLLTGDSVYGADFNRPGQLHARIVRSQVSHGTIRSIDTAAAARRPGVVSVITAQDIPDVHIPIRLFATENANRVLQRPLARDRVRYVGDPIAVVVAVDPYLAEDAADEIAVDVAPIAAVLDPVAAESASAALLHPAIGTNVIDRVSVSHGQDLDRLFEQAAIVIRQHFSVQRHGAVPLEPRCLIAENDPSASQLTVWGAAKVKHFNRRILATLLEREPESIRCIEGDVGGGFGARGEFYPEDYLIPWLAIELCRPVKWVEDRRENLIALNHSREQQWDVEYAAAKDGTLLAFRAKAWFNQGAYARTHGSVLLPNLMLNHTPGPYRWQAYEVEALAMLSNKTPAGTYRGPGQYEPTFVRERMVDLVARELGMDPVELRLRNLVGPEDMPYDSGLPDVDTGKPVLYDEGDFPRVFRALLEHVDYPALRRETDARQRRGERVGLAATAFIEMGNPGVFEQARVVAEEDGTFTAHVGIASVGQGVETVLSQIAADALRVPIERIRISYKDTAVVPEGQGAFSSRATVWGGYAITGAIRDLMQQATNAAAEKLEIAVEDLEVLDGGIIRPRGQPSGGLPMSELGVQGQHRYEPEGGSHILSGANVGLVRVDGDSGAVELERYAISYEVGRAINPLTLEGQVRGAAAQGIGGALFEEFAYDPEGQPLSTSFMDYALPSATEIPNIDVVLLEFGETAEDDPVAGAKGAGEGGVIATAATITAAVADAIGPAGWSLSALPLTPEVVQRLVREEPPKSRPRRRSRTASAKRAAE
jgi:aerobic carbon-monoxide dehydrogenase large subunit